MEQQTDSSLYIDSILAIFKTVYCHPVYLADMQGTSCKMPGWMNHELES